jgi:hypothetical protein
MCNFVVTAVSRSLRFHVVYAVVLYSVVLLRLHMSSLCCVRLQLRCSHALIAQISRFIYIYMCMALSQYNSVYHSASIGI